MHFSLTIRENASHRYIFDVYFFLSLYTTMEFRINVVLLQHAVVQMKHFVVVQKNILQAV